ncbi:glutamate--cysteine ligase isoform X3 [Oratosquilla oratoria]|uniref:glutamate--cysteine ligase isoform X3 n=1 Tax=Oratosquilla oratoria TaxID=337810 RepID=UPI003F76E7B4
MVEGTPGQPYGSLVQHFNIVEANMSFRRDEIQRLLGKDEIILTLTSFPRLGCKDFTWPYTKADPTKGPGRSLFFPEEAITQMHPRFKTLTRNIRERRGEKVAINIPIYKDTKTVQPFVEDFLPYGDDGSEAVAALSDHIYMDAMGFGMGCSCLQMTFQACNIDEARKLYDHLVPLCPIFLALTAASPIYRGMLSDIDCRWSVIAASVDCRTCEERGQAPLRNDKFNDLPAVKDDQIYGKLCSNDIDDLLAQHIAHLFIRDPISLFSEKIDQDDNTEMDHFENIQSTNWQTMRFKPPPPNSNIGWRVEFRPCEVQLTDFENSAYVVFVVLLTRAILSFNLNTLIPISKVDDNMIKSQKRNAVQVEKFWFRRDIYTRSCDVNAMDLMTIDEIINGKGEEFVGLVAVVRQYLSALDVDADTMCTIGHYLKFISQRAAGTALTTATWLRNFVIKHPEYRKDSVVTDGITYDLVMEAHQISQGEKPCPELLGGTPKTKTAEDIPQAVKKILESACVFK